MRAIVRQRTGKLVSPGLAALLSANLAELGDVGSHIAHIVQRKANHIRNIGQRATTSGVVEALLADITVNHGHEGQTAEHSSHGTTTLLSVAVDLVVEGVEGEDSLGRGCAHLLQVGQTSPVEHLLGSGFCISKRATAITATHGVAVGIGDGQALSTHDDGLVEQATSQRTLAERAHAATTGTLSEDGDVVGVATELRNILLNPLQGLNLVEDAVVAADVVRTLSRKGWVNEEAEDAQTVVDGDEHHVLGAPLLAVELRF